MALFIIVSQNDTESLNNRCLMCSVATAVRLSTHWEQLSAFPRLSIPIPNLSLLELDVGYFGRPLLSPGRRWQGGSSGRGLEMLYLHSSGVRRRRRTCWLLTTKLFLSSRTFLLKHLHYSPDRQACKRWRPGSYPWRPTWRTWPRTGLTWCAGWVTCVVTWSGPCRSARNPTGTSAPNCSRGNSLWTS